MNKQVPVSEIVSRCLRIAYCYNIAVSDFEDRYLDFFVFFHRSSFLISVPADALQIQHIIKSGSVEMIQ